MSQRLEFFDTKKGFLAGLSLFEIWNMASLLNLAVNYQLRFLNFDFGEFLAQLKRDFQKNVA